MNTPHKCLKKISVMPICVADLHIQNILYLFFNFFYFISYVTSKSSFQSKQSNREFNITEGFPLVLPTQIMLNILDWVYDFYVNAKSVCVLHLFILVCVCVHAHVYRPEVKARNTP